MALTGSGVSFEIVSFAAADGVELQGFLARGRTNRMAIYLHGLGGNGYRSAMMWDIARACRRRGIGFLSINTRGHDVVTTKTCRGRRTPHNGSVYEVFTECVRDIRGALSVARAAGARRIYLVGHSTGANKIAYALQRGVRVTGVVYVAPGDDVAIQRQLLGPSRYRAMQRLAQRLRGRQPHALMPVKNLGYVAISAASYASLFGPKNRMDQFPFSQLQPDPRWRRLVRSRTPACMILGDADEYLPTPATAIQAFMQVHLPSLPVRLVPGAGHSFRGHETVLARLITSFFA